MRILIQRVSEAKVEVGDEMIGQIERGLLLFLGFDREDSNALFSKTIDKIANLRIFSDDEGNMNRSAADVAGGILVVSQFTLYGNIRKGRRPSFTDSMSPESAEKLYDEFVAQLRETYTAGPVQTGSFGSMMQVHLVNDGPVTFWLDTRELGWNT